MPSKLDRWSLAHRAPTPSNFHVLRRRPRRRALSPTHLSKDHPLARRLAPKHHNTRRTLVMRFMKNQKPDGDEPEGIFSKHGQSCIQEIPTGGGALEFRKWLCFRQPTIGMSKSVEVKCFVRQGIQRRTGSTMQTLQARALQIFAARVLSKGVSSFPPRATPPPPLGCFCTPSPSPDGIR